jgi:hypothetical protein
MASFKGIEFFDGLANEWVLVTHPSSLNDLMHFMDYFGLNTVQLDVDQDRFLFYDPTGERYGLYDLHTLSSSTGVTLKNVRLHRFDQTIIDDRVNQFNMNNANFGIEISKKEDPTKSKKKRNSLGKKNPSILRTRDGDDDDVEKQLNSSITIGKFFSHYR